MARRSSGSALVRSPARSRLLPRSAQASVLGVERNGTTEFGGRGGKIAAHGIELTELTTCFHLVRLETERSTVELGRFAPAVLLDQQPGQREVGLGAAGFALQRQPELLFRARSVAGLPATCHRGPAGNLRSADPNRRLGPFRLPHADGPRGRRLGPGYCALARCRAGRRRLAGRTARFRQICSLNSATPRLMTASMLLGSAWRASRNFSSASAGRPLSMRLAPSMFSCCARWPGVT